MKLQLTIENARDQDLIDGLRELRTIRLTGDQAVLLDRATAKVADEYHRYHRLRNEWLKSNGDHEGDRDFIPGGDPRLADLRKFESELCAEKFEVRIVRKVQIPASCCMTANQFSALQDAGFVEAPAMEEEVTQETKPEEGK